MKTYSGKGKLMENALAYCFREMLKMKLKPHLLDQFVFDIQNTINKTTCNSQGTK